MDLVSAIKSGKRFSRPRAVAWCEPDNNFYSFKREDILADDWEIEEKSVMVTERELRDAFEKAADNREIFIEALIEELGLRE